MNFKEEESELKRLLKNLTDPTERSAAQERLSIIWKVSIGSGMCDEEGFYVYLGEKGDFNINNTQHCCCACGCEEKTYWKSKICKKCETFQSSTSQMDNVQKRRIVEHIGGISNIPRKGFSDTIKRKILKKQNFNCVICKKLLSTHDFDHIDGNRNNNDESNCQAVCPNCHAFKTRNLS